MQSAHSTLSQAQLASAPSQAPKPAESFVVASTFRGDADNAGDVLIIVQDTDFYVHRDLLWFSSSFFRDLLRENWAEGQLADDEEAALHRGEVDNDREEVKSSVGGALEPQASQAGDSGEPLEAAVSKSISNVVEAPPPQPPQSAEAALPDDASTANPPVILSEATDTAATDHEAQRLSYHTAQLHFDDASTSAPKSPVKEEQQSTLFPSATPSKGARTPGQTPTTDPTPLLSPTARSEALPSRETDPTIAISPTLSLQDLQLLETPPSSPRTKMLLATSSPFRSADGLATSSAPASTSAATISPERDQVGQRYPEGTTRVKVQRHRPISKPRGVIVTVLRLEEEEPSIFQSFLSAIYPHLRLAVSWRNIGHLMSFSDKYGVNQTLLFEPCRLFLEASLTGNPIEAMRLAEQFGLQGVFKEASKHVLDLYSVWSTHELSVLSKETLIKLERKRSWFLERLLKFSVANPQRDYECHSACPNPDTCAEALQARWNAAYLAAFRFGPPQPTIVWKHLRELEGGGPPLTHSACETACRTWVQTRFDRMFELGLAGPRARSQFLYILLDDTVLAKKAIRRRIRADQLPAPAHHNVVATATGLNAHSHSQNPLLLASSTIGGVGLGGVGLSGAAGSNVGSNPGHQGPGQIGIGVGVGEVVGSLLDFVNPL